MPTQNILEIIRYCNEEAVSLDPNAALLINKRRSNRQDSETVTGVTKAESSTGAMQRSGQAADRDDIKRQAGSKGRQQMVRVV